VVSEHRTSFFAFCSREKGDNFIAMLLRRRDRQLPDPIEEREMPRRRDRKIPDPTRERDMRELHSRMDSMEISQRHTVDDGDISEDESENEDRNEEFAVEDAVEERLFRVVARIGAREKMDINMYEGNLDVEELID
jgi:hypothetical protein